MRATSTADSAGWSRHRRLSAFALLLALVPLASVAQMGPVDADGFIEYRFTQFAGDGIDARSSHGVLARTNLSTFFWRPWILNTTGYLSFAERRADARVGDETSGDVYGGLRLNFLPRSAFPLTLYYDDFDGSVDSDTNSRSGRTKRYGFLQQYTSRRLGTYSLEWRGGSTDSIYQDGFSLPERNDNSLWQFVGRKGFGRNLFTLSSRSLMVDSQVPERRTDSLRHTLRHSFRIGSSFDVRNTAFYTNEELDSAMLQTGRTYRQFSSVTTWRPRTARRLLVTGRGLLQDSEIRGLMNEMGVQSIALSGTANYQYTDNLTLTAGLGFLAADNAFGDTPETTFQRIGGTYNSDNYPVLDGSYRYFGQLALGNRSNPAELGEGDVQDLGTSLGHSYTRSFGNPGRGRWEFRVSQRASTVHDTIGRERNSLQHSISLTNGARAGRMSRYFRVSLLDQRNFADERRDYQLVNLQYTMQGQVTRKRSWNANASVQYGRRAQEKPVLQSMESASLSYSITAGYRHTELFDVHNLTFTSDLRWISEDFRSEDPFSPDVVLDTERMNSSWRNRLEYRIGLLQLRADADLREVNGMWSAAFLLTARRYFGMR